MVGNHTVQSRVDNGFPTEPTSLTLGDRYWRENRYEEALVQYQQAVSWAPEVADYRVRLGKCAWMLRQLDTAELELQEAYRLAPNHPVVHRVLAEFCFAIGKIDRSLFHSGRAYQLNPRDTEIVITRATILHENAQSDDAWRLVAPLLKSGVCSVPLAVLYARLAGHVKLETAALSCINHLLKFGNVSDHGAARLHLAAAALADRLGRHGEAFEHARSGKEKWPLAYDPSQTSQLIDRRIEYFTPAKLRDLPRASHGNRRPVFIIGMPRSGTTLVEQILASHSQVYGGGELQALPSIAHSARNILRASCKDYPQLLDAMTTDVADDLAERYLSQIAAIDDSATFVTDKMPDNFLLLGLIATLFPQSHVIHCVRNPLDTCLSCYMNYFAGGQAYSHDLTHLGAYYRGYERLMTHWKSVLDFPLIEVCYENLIADPVHETRKLVAQLGLPWEDECLNFYRNRRPVLTPSCDQVRRPLYASSVGRWKHYSNQLAPLISALGRSADQYS